MKLDEITQPKYQAQIEKQIPINHNYKPRMGLMKSKGFFFTVDSEFCKAQRIADLKANKEIVSFLLEEKEKIHDCFFRLNNVLKVSCDTESEDSIKFCFTEMAKWSDADILIIDEELKLIASAVCFPTGWEPKEKLGKTVFEAHQVIPSVNKEIGKSISLFLEKLTPNESYQRSNIGFLSGDFLDCRPSKNIQRISQTASINEVWVRVENQAFLKLENGCVVFGIKIENIPLKFFIMNTENKQGLLSMLMTMPKEMAEYKGISNGIKERIISLIQRGI